MKRNLLLFAGLTLLAACSSEDASPPPSEPQSPAPMTVTVMTFNVENLFDTTHDEGKNDHTFLPRALKSTPEHIARCELIEVDRWRRDCLELDWTEEALSFKLDQLGKTILQVNDGKGPDILALQEIENIGILTRLVQEQLQPAGYGDPILTEGQDIRGIDVAFLTRLPLASEPVLHPFTPTGYEERTGDTRGVLQATFRLPDGSFLTGFSAHFPAPFHPIEMRELAYDHLKGLRSRVAPDHIVFAAGDFNTPAREMSGTTILDDHVRPVWTIAHEVDCDGCKGTNFWANENAWSFLDMILYSPAVIDVVPWRMKKGGVFIADDYKDQLKPDGTVKRFNLEALEGVSDHLPVVMTLELLPTQ